MGKLEFFIGSDDKVWIRQGDSCRQFTMKETEIIELLRGKIERIYPTATRDFWKFSMS